MPPPARVVSLVPSITETLFDLGVGDRLVGITDYCIFPPGLSLPRVGGTKNPRIETIRSLQPDLVYMNCEENLQRHARDIEQFAPVHLSEPKSVDDVRHLIIGLGAIHETDRAAAFIDRLDAELASMPTLPFSFACAIWKRPWMWCGGDTYISDLITRAGGGNILQERKRYPAIDPDEIRADVIFLPDEPYPFTEADAAMFRSRVIGPFPGHLMTWHGTRTLLGLQFLRGLALQ